MTGTRAGAKKSPWMQFCAANRDYKRRDAELLRRLEEELVAQGIDAAPVLRTVQRLLEESRGVAPDASPSHSSMSDSN